jgi:general secretion pathway protein B
MATVAKPKTPPASASEKSAATSDSSASPALLAELPQDIRQQIPALTINGAVYSDNPAQRLLLVNSQVLSQGALVAPDLTLERIGANTSEFSFRGTRFRLAH